MPHQRTTGLLTHQSATPLTHLTRSKPTGRPPIISQVITTIEKALEKVLAPLNRPVEESLRIPGSLVVDGTLIPTWNWRS